MKIKAGVVAVSSRRLQRIGVQGGDEGWSTPLFVLSREPDRRVHLHICQASAAPHELHSSGFSFTPPHSKGFCLPYRQGLSLTYQPDAPLKGNCEGEADEVMGWGQKMEEKERHRVAAKELVTSQTWHITLSRWVAQPRAVAFPSHATWSTSSASRPMGGGSALACASEEGTREVCVCSAAEWL